MSNLIPLRQLLSRTVLAGRSNATIDRSILVRHLEPVGNIAVFDLSGIESISASYCVPVFRDFVTAEEEPRLYPMFANASHDVLDDLSTCLHAWKCHAWAATWANGLTIDPQVIGAPLDETYRGIIRSAQVLVSISATDLHHLDPSVVATAWNNRLATLHRSRLLRRSKDGRRAIYTLPWGHPHG